MEMPKGYSSTGISISINPSSSVHEVRVYPCSVYSSETAVIKRKIALCSLPFSFGEVGEGESLISFFQ